MPKLRRRPRPSLNLRPMAEVARLWNERSGERISRSAVYLILKSAEAKIAKSLSDSKLN